MKSALRDLTLEYLDYLEASKGLSEHTRLAYRRDLEAWNRFLEAQGESVLSAGSLDAGKFLRTLGKNGMASSSVNRILSCLRGFYRFLVKTERTKVHPFNAIHSLKKARTLPSFLFEKEVLKLIGLPKDGFQGARDRLIFELLYGTGCRVGELCSIRLKDISPDRSRIKVVGKGSKARFVFLTASARAALEVYEVQRRTRELQESGREALLLNRFGGRLGVRGLAKILLRYVKQSGIVKNVTPHTFRHTFATHLLSEGMDVRVVQELLGHSRLETTQVYTHLSLDRLRDVVRSAHPHG